MNLFLSYNSKDRNFIEAIASALKDKNFNVFYDVESIQAGTKWLQVIEEGIKSSNGCLIFIGNEGIGEWQNKEILKILNDFTQNKSYRIIPVVIPGSQALTTYVLPWFLSDYQWVEFKNSGDKYALSRIEEALKLTVDNQVVNDSNPYKGLASFEVDDSDFFYGRNYDLNLVFHSKLRLHLSIANNNFLAVVADSGTGKSSFVKAGILAALKQGRIEGSRNWKQLIVKPGNNPLMTLSAALVRNAIISDSRTFEENAKKFDDELLRKFTEQDNTWVIYFDQFEEVITQCKDEKERTAFLKNIARAVEAKNLVLLISLRSDFYTKFSSYISFKTLLEKNNYTLSTIDINQEDAEGTERLLREIIEKPAKQNGVEIKSSLVNTLIREIKNVKGTLPVISLTMNLLWKNKKTGANVITLDDFEAIAGGKNLGGIIQIHADNVFRDLTNNEADTHKSLLIKKIFVPHLIELTRSGDDVRRSADKQDILQISGYGKNEIESLLTELSGERARLLIVNEKERGIFKVEVVHEIIIREWDKLKIWINERRKVLEYRERISNDAIDYKNNKSTELYNGEKLTYAKGWLKENKDLANQEIEDFIKASQSRKTKNTLITYLSIGIFLIVAGLGLFYLNYFLEKKSLDTFTNQSDVKEQIEKQGDALDSVKYLTINSSSYFFLQDNLKHFKNLDSIEITRVSNAVIDLRAVGDSLIKVSLNYSDIDSSQKIKLKSSIKQLTIEVTSIRNLNGIENPSLTSLVIIDNDNLKNLNGIKNLTSLTSLSISTNKSLKNINEIKNLRSLTSLEISNNRYLRNLNGIENLRSLTSLEIFGNDSIKDLKVIENLDSLKSLNISNIDSLPNLIGIENFISLTTLAICNNNSLTSLDGIEKLKNLKHLEIFEDDTIVLPFLSKLNNLKLNNLKELKIYTYSKTDDKELKLNNPGLKILRWDDPWQEVAPKDEY